MNAGRTATSDCSIGESALTRTSANLPGLQNLEGTDRTGSTAAAWRRSEQSSQGPWRKATKLAACPPTNGTSWTVPPKLYTGTPCQPGLRLPVSINARPADQRLAGKGGYRSPPKTFLYRRTIGLRKAECRGGRSLSSCGGDYAIGVSPTRETASTNVATCGCTR